MVLQKFNFINCVAKSKGKGKKKTTGKQVFATSPTDKRTIPLKLKELLKNNKDQQLNRHGQRIWRVCQE